MNNVKFMIANAVAKKALAIDKTQRYFATHEYRLNRLLSTIEQIVYICSH